MVNLWYKRICIAILAVLLLGMVASLFSWNAEIRPKLTISGLLDGTYFRAYETYYAETFAARDLMAEDFADLQGLLSFETME